MGECRLSTKKFQGHWIYPHHFTIELAKGTKYAYMSKTLMPLKIQPSKKTVKIMIK
jgi:hypothetical protein